jgi:hypothetical protein
MLNAQQVRQLFQELNIPAQRIAEGSPIDITCPFEKLHTHHDGRPSCRLWFETHPHLHCFHLHCHESIYEKNLYLRLIITGTTEFPEDFNPASGMPAADYAFARQVARDLPKLVRRFRPRLWPPEPIPLAAPIFLERLGVFKGTDHIWVGNERDSGHPLCATHFRTLAEWKEAPPPLSWAFTTGAAFLPGSFSRSIANIKAHRALILESDALPPAETAAMAWWIEQTFNLPLLALVHSGNKSLHCYYPHPGPEWIAKYRPALAEVGFDSGSLRPAQPMRLANQKRSNNGAPQHLLFLKNHG